MTTTKSMASVDVKKTGTFERPKMIEVMVFQDKVINFVGMFPFMTGVSVFLTIASIVLIFTKGLNFGVDFKGGAEVQVKFAQRVETALLRDAFVKSNITVSSIQTIGDDSSNEFLIKIPVVEGKDINLASTGVIKELKASFPDKGIDIRKTEIVGPKAGEQLRTSGFWAMLWSILGIMVYVGLRFDMKYAPGAVVSLLHDAIIVLGLFVITGKEFNLQILGAILALIGYSVNDTVVIYDRIREHEKSSQQAPIVDLINKGLTETIARTILTAGTTFSVCLIMFLFGGGVIHDFFFALWAGIIVGTYSSVFVASPLVLVLYRLVTKRKWDKHKA